MKETFELSMRVSDSCAHGSALESLEYLLYPDELYFGLHLICVDSFLTSKSAKLSCKKSRTSWIYTIPLNF